MESRKQERGVALLVVLVISMVLVVIAGAVVVTTTATSKRISRERAEREALDVAEAGIEWAIAALDPSNLGAVATGSVPFGNGAYWISATDLTDGLIALRATASVGVATRSLEVILGTSPLPVGNYAIATGQNLTMSGNITVTSSPTTGVGHIHSNGNISISGANTEVYGRASAVGSVNPPTYAKVYGGIQQSAATVAIPSYTNDQVTGYRTQAQSVASRSSSSFDNATLSGYYNGSISISGNQNVVFSSPVVYINGNLSISGNVNLTASSQTLLIVTGTVSISGNPDIVGPSGGGLGIVSLHSGSGALNLSGNDQMRAVLFAPNGSVSLSGNVGITGSILASGMGTVSGNVNFTRDTDSTFDVLGLSSFGVQSWREVPN